MLYCEISKTAEAHDTHAIWWFRASDVKGVVNGDLSEWGEDIARHVEELTPAHWRGPADLDSISVGTG